MVQATLSAQLSCSWIKVWIVEHPWLPWGRVCVPAGNIPVSHHWCNRTRAVPILYPAGIPPAPSGCWRTPRTLLWSKNISVGRCFQKWWMFPLWFADDSEWFGLQMFGSFIGLFRFSLRSNGVIFVSLACILTPISCLSTAGLCRADHWVGFALVCFGLLWFFSWLESLSLFGSLISFDKTEGLILQVLDFSVFKTSSCPYTREECLFCNDSLHRVKFPLHP